MIAKYEYKHTNHFQHVINTQAYTDIFRHSFSREIKFGVLKNKNKNNLILVSFHILISWQGCPLHQMLVEAPAFPVVYHVSVGTEIIGLSP